MVRQKFVINPLAKPDYDQSADKGASCWKLAFARLTSRKSITQLQSEAATNNDLKRTLGSFQLLALGVGSIIGEGNTLAVSVSVNIGSLGTGIFVLSGEAAAKYAGPSVIISFLVAALVAGLAALSYAEMASMVPISGSAYSYTYASKFHTSIEWKRHFVLSV